MNLLLLFIFSFTTFAFTGKYSGEGAAVFSTGKRYECREIFLHLKTEKDVFKLLEGGYLCGDLLHASYDPFQLTIRDGRLFHKEKELGKISDSELRYEVHDPSDDVTFKLTLKKTPSGEILYHEEWHDGEKVALTIKGKLLNLSH